MTPDADLLDPPEPEIETPSNVVAMTRGPRRLITPPDGAVVESDGSVTIEPTELIPVDKLIAQMEGVTAKDIAEAIVLEEQALAIRTIDDDLLEEHVGELIDQLAVVDTRVEAKGEKVISLANKLHKGFLSLFGERGTARQHTQAGLKHLRPLLAGRLEAKRQTEAQRQREDREKALRDAQDRKLQEAAHLESTGASKEEVDYVLEEAQALPPPAVAARPITNIAGASTRDNWKCEIVSRLELIKYVATHPEFANLLEVNTTAVNQLARAQKSGLRVPGLRAYNDAVLTKRR